ncbi:MAG: hypothetical protein HYR67_02110 [Bacteroidetes bacterium]|nr:hypothetical protein [Bacteroidota bacterium]
MKLTRSIVSGFLASLVLIASIGVTVNLHLCAGQVQSIAVFVKAQPCKEMQKPCHGTERHAKKNGCCEEKSILLKGKETTAEVKAATQITPSFNLIAVILPVLYSIDLDSFVAAPRYAHYKPPLIERDITILAQSFLI